MQKSHGGQRCYGVDFKKEHKSLPLAILACRPSTFYLITGVRYEITKICILLIDCYRFFLILHLQQRGKQQPPAKINVEMSQPAPIGIFS